MEMPSKYPHLMRYLQQLKSIPGGTFHFGVTPHAYETRHIEWLLTNVGILFDGKHRMSPTPTELWDRKIVRVAPYRMGETPVTWGVWKEYCKVKGVRMPDDPGWGFPDNHPVVNICWDDIMKPGGFADWATQLAGYKVTLPTDVQMEYASRGGKDGQLFPWGNTFDVNRVWCSNPPDGLEITAPVHRPNRIYRNSYGLTDMVGNVVQWCADYHVQLAGLSPSQMQERRQYYSKAQMVCVRGGSYMHYNPSFFQCESRMAVDKNYGCKYYGFRLVAETR